MIIGEKGVSRPLGKESRTYDVSDDDDDGSRRCMLRTRSARSRTSWAVRTGATEIERAATKSPLPFVRNVKVVVATERNAYSRTRNMVPMIVIVIVTVRMGPRSRALRASRYTKGR